MSICGPAEAVPLLQSETFGTTEVVPCYKTSQSKRNLPHTRIATHEKAPNGNQHHRIRSHHHRQGPRPPDPERAPDLQKSAPGKKGYKLPPLDVPAVDA